MLDELVESSWPWTVSFFVTLIINMDVFFTLHMQFKS